MSILDESGAGRRSVAPAATRAPGRARRRPPAAAQPGRGGLPRSGSRWSPCSRAARRCSPRPDPTASKITEALAPMGGAHPLGTDGVGRDVLAQLLYGARTSLIGALIVVVVVARRWGCRPASWPATTAAGSTRLASWVREPVHGAAGDHRAAGRARAVRPQHRAGHGRVRRADRPRGLPADPGLGDRPCARSSTSTPPGSPASVTGGSCAGTSCPVVVAPTVIQVSQLLGIAIVIQAGLEFLGLGSANQASWGGMLSDAFQNIYTAAAAAAVARPGDRADGHRLQPARQRAARRARRRRRAAASAPRPRRRRSAAAPVVADRRRGRRRTASRAGRAARASTTCGWPTRGRTAPSPSSSRACP